LLVGGEQVVTPADGAAQRFLAGRYVAQAVDRKHPRPAEMSQQLVRREQLDAGCDQLDRQGQAIQPAAQLGYHGGVGVDNGKIRLNGLGAVQKKGHSRIV